MRPKKVQVTRVRYAACQPSESLPQTAAAPLSKSPGGRAGRREGGVPSQPAPGDQTALQQEPGGEGDGEGRKGGGKEKGGGGGREREIHVSVFL